MAQMTSTRNDEIRQIHRRYADFYKISGGIFLVIIGIGIGSLFFSDGYATNVYTELLSVIATIVVLDRLNDWRETKRHQQRLIRQASGQSNELAKAAVDEMRAEGWLTIDDDIHLLGGAKLGMANLREANLYDANLQNAELWVANLTGANLYAANLQRAILSNAKLQNVYMENANIQNADMQKANLHRADLQDAKLMGSNLHEAVIRNANMQGTKLLYTNLQDVDLEEANLHGASLLGANLQGASLINTNLTNATLPDGVKWTPETDMSRYTDPNHPDFWQPDWVKEQN